MQFDSDHLVQLFYSSSQLFDIEGRLFVQRVQSRQAPSERQYQECFCRLRGNLLLIGENCTAQQAPNLDNEGNSQLSIALVILNKFEIKLCDESKPKYEFCLHLHKSANFIEKYHFICASRSERDQWIQCLYFANFDILRSIHQALSDNFKEKLQNEVNLKYNYGSPLNLGSSEGCFIRIKCDQLLHQVNIDPFVYVKVFARQLYIDRKWRYLARTEQIQSRSPLFASWIHVPYPRNVNVQLKFEVYKSVDFLDTAFLVALSYFILPNNSQCENQYRLPLLGINDKQSFGTLSFKAIHRSQPNPLNKCTSLETLQPPRSDNQLAMSTSNLTALDSESIIFNDGKVFRKEFAFQVLSGKPELIIEETLEEVDLSFKIPLILM